MTVPCREGGIETCPMYVSSFLFEFRTEWIGGGRGIPRQLETAAQSP